MPDEQEYQAQDSNDRGYPDESQSLGGSDRDLFDEPSSDDDTSGERGKVKTYAGKYKSVDDLEKGYKEAERRLHQETSDTKQLKRQLDELATWKRQMEQAFGGRSQMSQEEYRQLAAEAMENDPVGYIDHRLQSMLSEREQQREIRETAKDAFNVWISKPENQEFTDPDMHIALSVAIQNLNQNPETAYLDPFSKLQQAKEAVEKWISGISEKRARKKLNQEQGLNNMAAFEVGTQTTSKGGDENKPESYGDYMNERRKARDRLTRR